MLACEFADCMTDMSISRSFKRRCANKSDTPIVIMRHTIKPISDPARTSDPENISDQLEFY